MKNKSNTNFNGYIEGYYGKLLNWENRKKIVKSLAKNNMAAYFYAPKEDIKHRIKWRESYSKKWRQEFRSFVQFSNLNNVKVIAGIAPGLDFDFTNFFLKSDFQNHSDFNFLVKKVKQFLYDGADCIALLLDDIPDSFCRNNKNFLSEGESHGILVNKLSSMLNIKIYFVPRIYANELIYNTPQYILDLSKSISNQATIFYCGQNVVSKSIKLNHIKHLRKLMSNKIIFWDNFYANDYCPRRIFLGPWKGRNNINNIFFNPTGMINTDLFLIDVIGHSIKLKDHKKGYKNALIANNIPKQFNQLLKFFNAPTFNDNLSIKKLIYTKQTLKFTSKKPTIKNSKPNHRHTTSFAYALLSKQSFPTLICIQWMAPTIEVI